MNTKTKITVCLSVAMAAMISGCTATVTPVAPTVSVDAGPVGVTVTPDSYVWDGTEYVGVVGGQYYYLNGGAWVVAPGFILDRFHGWEHGHPDWRNHMVRNDHRMERRGGPARGREEHR